jgi:hypothetical protein
VGSLDANTSSRDSALGVGRKGRFHPVFYVIIGLIGIILVGYVFISRILHADKVDPASVLLAKTSLLDVEAVHEYHSDWLRNNLSEGSADFYDGISKGLISVLPIVPATGDLVFRGWIGFIKGLLRVSFMITAWWKFWLLAIAVMAIWSMRSFQVWFGQDILGQQTNGRLFYSGIRADLKKISKQGAPDVQTPGLACAKMVSISDAQRSSIGRVLARHKATNKTTLKLAATILAYPKWPAFIAARAEGGLLDSAYQGASLPEHAALVLGAALNLRDTYREYSSQIERLEDQEDDHSIPENLDAEQYAQELKYAFNRVLPNSWKLAMAEMSPAELATVVLSNEAGKVMAYKEEGPRLVRGSVFPQLCARAILHSIPDYSSEFSYDERNNIRQSIIYGSRKSVFGPVKFLTDLSPQTRAARQWMELLMACPHELEQVADEVELYGLLCTIHDDWLKAFFDELMISAPTDLTDIISHSTMMYVPFKRVMSYFRKTVDQERLDRLHVLARSVSDRQQLAIAEGVATGTTKVPDYLKIFAPITDAEITKMVKQHNLNPADVKDWSALRLVLNYYSWLGRRVGDSTVPDNSVIFLAARRQKYDTELPTLTSECHVGMVALRATKLVDRWGSLWSKKFDSVMTVTAVDDMQEYEKFKRGESLDDFDTPSPDGASVG